MARFFLLLLLAFALRPAVAEASLRPGGEDASVAAATQESPRDALPAVGFQLRTVSTGVVPERHPHESGADGPARCRHAPSVSPSPAEVRQENGVFSPLCEHLPYDATAPPLPR